MNIKGNNAKPISYGLARIGLVWHRLRPAVCTSARKWSFPGDCLVAWPEECITHDKNEHRWNIFEATSMDKHARGLNRIVAKSNPVNSGSGTYKLSEDYFLRRKYKASCPIKCIQILEISVIEDKPLVPSISFSQMESGCDWGVSLESSSAQS